ncbi:MAG TPA: hypothetical protein DC049_10755 [Spirochaetia bacterium]|nr:hypothetical protein [Spirochaetia bacterium]
MGQAIIFNFQKLFSMLLNFIDLFFGRHHRINRRFARKHRGIIEHYKVKSVKISKDEPFDFHVDGELFCAEKSKNGKYTVKCRVIGNAVSFLVPPHFFAKFHPF